MNKHCMKAVVTPKGILANKIATGKIVPDDKGVKVTLTHGEDRINIYASDASMGKIKAEMLCNLKKITIVWEGE